MKNTILLVCACLAALSTRAQISAGLVVGVQSAQSHHSAPKFVNQHRNDWHAGAVADIPISKRISLRPMVMHEKYGMDFAAISAYCIGTYKLPLKNGSYLFCGIGPYVAFDTYKYIGPGKYVNGQIIEDGWLKRVNRGGYADIGYHFRNGIVIQAYYERILMNMLNDEVEPWPFQKISMYYDNFGVSAGYLFRFSKRKKGTVVKE